MLFETMTFGAESAARSLASSADAIRALLRGLPDEQIRWKPALEKWSVLEVVNHLADEEAEDFRARLDILIHRPDEPFTPIDPPGWVTARRYLERDLEESVARFSEEREKSLRWLAGLQDPNLGNRREHPAAGTLSGRQMLASWVAHDLLHVRQLARLRYQYLEHAVRPISVEYAGGW